MGEHLQAEMPLLTITMLQCGQASHITTGTVGAKLEDPRNYSMWLSATKGR